MRNAPSENALAALPRLYSTESILVGDKIIHMRFFLPGYDWYVATFDGQDAFMGFIAVHGDTANAVWGYFSLSELKKIKLSGVEVDRDMDWNPIPAKDIGIGV
ncbi:MAG: DUF2958 domain-containing protein [Betaproteobacteria bacterium]|nr:DUF2958 domain-containing protein [Betaproteobacteria bacterium]